VLSNRIPVQIVIVTQMLRVSRTTAMDFCILIQKYLQHLKKAPSGMRGDKALAPTFRDHGSNQIALTGYFTTRTYMLPIIFSMFVIFVVFIYPDFIG
jgi:hypothetical protein